jgi:hypothetical protein
MDIQGAKMARKKSTTKAVPSIQDLVDPRASGQVMGSHVGALVPQRQGSHVGALVPQRQGSHVGALVPQSDTGTFSPTMVQTLFEQVKTATNAGSHVGAYATVSQTTLEVHPMAVAPQQQPAPAKRKK